MKLEDVKGVLSSQPLPSSLSCHGSRREPVCIGMNVHMKLEAPEGIDSIIILHQALHAFQISIMPAHLWAIAK